MSIEVIDTVVVGGGQAGVAMSEHLSAAGVEHVVLERHRIAERWRTSRWDSLVANGPAWHDRFPGMEFKGHPDSFPGKEEVAEYFEDYAKMIGAPIRCNVEVKSVERLPRTPGFEVTTSAGTFHARNVVAATGPFQVPVIPDVVPKDAGIIQIHSIDYRNPEQLAPGAVLVVGAGSSGGQIADELMRSGRTVYLSVGPHERPPRAYRNRDFCWWLGVLGKWDAETRERGKEHVTISVSGARGGSTVDFRRLAQEGLRLVGSTKNFSNGKIFFERDLSENLAMGDTSYLSLLNEADAYVERNGIILPEEPEAHILPPDPVWVTEPTLEIDVKRSDITTIIWATGFASDYSWLKVDVFDENGKPKHQRGVTSEPGIYFLGLPWQSRRGSAFIWGVWHDAKHVADRIKTLRRYAEYHAQNLPQPALLKSAAG